MGWYPEETLSRLEALRGFTYSAAYAAFQEDALGSIAPGKYADFVVYAKNWMDQSIVPESGLWKILPRTTVIGGKVVFGTFLQ